jgi:acyl-CoA synthetase (NDP forming)
MNKNTIKEILKNSEKENRFSLMEYEVYEILQAMDLPVPGFAIFSDSQTLDEKKLNSFAGDHVILKIVSPTILHKSDLGGVAKVAKSMDAVMQAATKMKESLKAAGKLEELRSFMVCEMLPFPQSFGHELLVSAKSDPAFGEIVTLGLGGVNTEYYAKWMKSGNSIGFFTPEIKDTDKVKQKLQSLPPVAVLTGETRQSSDYSLDVFYDFTARLGELLQEFSQENTELPTIEEIEINPVVACEGKLYALDGVLKFSHRKLQRPQRPVHKINNLLYPKSACVIGVSANRANQGKVILDNLIEGGGMNTDHLYVIHPKEDKIAGCKCVKSFADLPEKVDMTVLSVPASSPDGSSPAARALKEAIAANKTESVILIPGGLGETQEGKVIQAEIEELIAKSRELPDQGPVIDGGNCLGIISAPGKYNTFFIPTYKLPFDKGPLHNVAFISQSGAFLVTELSRLNKMVEPRYAISFGNQMDLTVCDYLDALKNDEGIKVFGVYIEGFKTLDGKRLVQLAQEIRALGKKIVLFKGGRTALGAQAAASHTAAIAGEFGIFRDLLTQAGIFITESMDEYDEVLMTFAGLSDRKQKLKTVSIITNAGFESTLASDSVGELEAPEFNPTLFNNIESLMPKGIVDIHNPLDLTPMVDWKDTIKIADAIIHSEQFDGMVFAGVPMVTSVETLPAGDSHSEDIFRDGSYPRQIIELFHSTDKPFVVSVDAGELYDPMAKMLKEAGIPVFRRVDNALNALNHWADYYC